MFVFFFFEEQTLSRDNMSLGATGTAGGRVHDHWLTHQDAAAPFPRYDHLSRLAFTPKRTSTDGSDERVYQGTDIMNNGDLSGS